MYLPGFVFTLPILSWSSWTVLYKYLPGFVFTLPILSRSSGTVLGTYLASSSPSPFGPGRCGLFKVPTWLRLHPPHSFPVVVDCSRYLPGFVFTLPIWSRSSWTVQVPTWLRLHPPHSVPVVGDCSRYLPGFVFTLPIRSWSLRTVQGTYLASSSPSPFVPGRRRLFKVPTWLRLHPPHSFPVVVDCSRYLPGFVFTLPIRSRSS